MRRWEEYEEPEEERFLGMTALQFNLAFFLVAGVIAAAAFLYFGGTNVLDDLVGDGEPVSSAALSATPTPATRSPAATPEEAAQAALLTLEDMPDGWTLAGEDAEPAGPGDVEIDASQVTGDALYPEECDFEQKQVELGELASADSDEFAGPRDQKLSAGTAVFSGEDRAIAAFDAAAAEMDGCQDGLAAFFQQSLAAEIAGPTPEAATEVDVTPREPALPAVTDSLNAYRLAVSVLVEDGGGVLSVRVDFALDFIFLRSGSVVEALYYFSPSDEASPAEEEALVRRAAQKLASADASLGGG